MRLGRLTTLGIAIVLLGVVATFASSVVLATEDACSSGGAVADPDNNPGLVADCAALMAARDTLAGTDTHSTGRRRLPSLSGTGSPSVEGTPPTRHRAESEEIGRIPVELGRPLQPDDELGMDAVVALP